MKTNRDPLDEIAHSLDELKSRQELAPVCLSTVGEDGFPNSRFVDLKEVWEGRLLFGTDERSAKAREFRTLPRVSLCGWWSSLQVQVRVIGTVERASASISDRVFSERNPTAKALAWASVQSQEIAAQDELRRRVGEGVLSGETIGRPPTWWVYAVAPVRVEILTFSDDRIHLRREFVRSDAGWTQRMLSP